MNSPSLRSTACYQLFIWSARLAILCPSSVRSWRRKGSPKCGSCAKAHHERILLAPYGLSGSLRFYAFTCSASEASFDLHPYDGTQCRLRARVRVEHREIGNTNSRNGSIGEPARLSCPGTLPASPVKTRSRNSPSRTEGVQRFRSRAWTGFVARFPRYRRTSHFTAYL